MVRGTGRLSNCLPIYCLTDNDYFNRLKLTAVIDFRQATKSPKGKFLSLQIRVAKKIGELSFICHPTHQPRCLLFSEVHPVLPKVALSFLSFMKDLTKSIDSRENGSSLLYKAFSNSICSLGETPNLP